MSTIVRRLEVLPSPLVLKKGLNALMPTPRSQIELILMKRMKPMVENSTQILLKLLCNFQTMVLMFEFRLIFLIEGYYCTLIPY